MFGTTRAFLIAALAWAGGGWTLHAQTDTTVILENGAVFQGYVVVETETFLDLSVGQGRIRLQKTDIRERSGGDSNGDPASIDPAENLESNTGARRQRRERFPAWLRDGADHVTPLRGMRKYQPEMREAEETALTFCREFQQGKAADVIESMVNPERLLQSAFPNAARGLTSYSRRLAARMFMRVVMAACSRSGIRESLGHARLSARRTPGPDQTSIVEVSFHLGDGEPIIVYVGVSDGKIVDLRQGPPPVPQIIAEIEAGLQALDQKSWQLVPVLEKVVELEVTRSLPGGDGSGGASAVSSRQQVWSLRPKDRRYLCSLPWAWTPAEEDSVPNHADFLLHTQDGRCAAMGVTEPGAIPLAELEEASMKDMGRTLGAFDQIERREIALAGARAVRIRIRTKDLQTPLTYELLLVVIQNRACRFVAWCRSEDHGELSSALESIFDGIRFLN